ncbi:MAG: hypothetical protein RIF36_24955 [Imperialibacter sp.]|uniref:hypothetical protein n=1 Tax=Imperialibacter sp. TaxID=2038411 RepID=UPI0032EF1392
MIIGNRETISFELSGFTGGLLNVNFYLGNRLVTDEPAHAPTYSYSFQKNLARLRIGDFKNQRLNGLTPIQLVRTIETERNSNEPQFFKHLLQIDETIDQFQIYLLETNGLTSFTWYNSNERAFNSEEDYNKIYSTELSTSELTSTLERLNSELEKELANTGL